MNRKVRNTRIACAIMAIAAALAGVNPSVRDAICQSLESVVGDR